MGGDGVGFRAGAGDGVLGCAGDGARFGGADWVMGGGAWVGVVMRRGGFEECPVGWGWAGHTMSGGGGGMGGVVGWGWLNGGRVGWEGSLNEGEGGRGKMPHKPVLGAHTMAWFWRLNGPGGGGLGMPWPVGDGGKSNDAPFPTEPVNYGGGSALMVGKWPPYIVGGVGDIVNFFLHN